MNTSKQLLFATAASLFLVACQDNKSTSASGSGARTAVKVNGQVINVAEIDSKLGMHSGEKKPQQISEQMMASIINMELMRQAALEAKLDQDEVVRAKLANSSRTILAMAYMEKQLAAITKPTEAEVKAYFDQHPERFAERKHYQLQELMIQAPAAMQDDIKSQLAKTGKFELFEKWLTEKNLPHTGNPPVSATADNIPDEILQKLKKVPVGGNLTLEGTGQWNIHVLFVLSEQIQPIDLATASHEITAMVWEQRRKETMDNMVKQQRDKAKIEYVPPYSEKGLIPQIKPE